MQPPAQEIVAKDLHDSTWTFRHIYRGIALSSSLVILSFFLLVYALLIPQQDSLLSKTQRCNIIWLKLNLSQKEL